MFNIFKKKEPTIAPVNYSGGQNYSSAPTSNSSTSLWKPKTTQQSFQSLFSSPLPQAPRVTQPKVPQSTSSVYGPARPGSSGPATTSPNFIGPSAMQGPQKPKFNTNTSPVPYGPPSPPPANPQLTLMDTFLKGQQATADQKKKTTGDMYNAGNAFREGTFNLQQDQLSGMKGSATDAFNQFEQGTLGGLERVRGQAERNKANVEDYAGDQQRTAAQARRETQGDAQRRFSNLNTIDSFGEGSFKQANENIDSDFNRVTQQIAKDKSNKLAEIDDQTFSAQQTAEQAIQGERVKLQQVLRQIDGSLQQGTMEHKFAQDQAMAEYQDSISGIDDWFNGIKYQTDTQKLALQQELSGMNSLSPEFMATGVPSNQQEYEFLIKNQDAFGKIYPDLFGSGQNGSEEKGQIIDLVDKVLSTDTNNLTGAVRLGGFYSSQARDTKALVEQIKAKLALNAREKLKGQGAISDSDARMLENAVTSLNYGGSDEAFRNELNNIRMIMQKQGGIASSPTPDNTALIQQYGG